MNAPSRRNSRTRRGFPGQALVEFALVLPIFILLLMVLVDFGRVVYAQNAINQGAREGARAGSVGTLAPLTQAKYDVIRNAALRLSPGVDMTAGTITGASVVCAPADTVSPTTCFYPDGTSGGQRVVVNITVPVPLLTPIISDIVGGSITVRAQSVVKIQ